MDIQMVIDDVIAGLGTQPVPRGRREIEGGIIACKRTLVLALLVLTPTFIGNRILAYALEHAGFHVVNFRSMVEAMNSLRQPSKRMPGDSS